MTDGEHYATRSLNQWIEKNYVNESPSIQQFKDES